MATNYITKYTNGAAGVEAVVTLTSKGAFAVTVVDTDAQETVGMKILFTLEAADAYAKACAA